MPRYIIRRSPERAEYLMWSTVVDAPITPVLDREALIDWLRHYAHLNRDEAEQSIGRADRTGTSMHDPKLGDPYDVDRVLWVNNPPEGIGEPDYDDEGREWGRRVTRDELFDACRQQ